MSENDPREKGGAPDMGVWRHKPLSCVPTNPLTLLENGVPSAIHCPAWSPGGFVEGAGVEQVWVNPGQRDSSEQKGKLCGGDIQG